MKNKLLPEVYLPLIVIFIATALPLSLFNGENASVLFGIFTYTSLTFILALFVRYLMIRDKEKNLEAEKVNRVEKHMVHNLDDKTVYLIDYENTSHLPKDINNATEDFVYYVFANTVQMDTLRSEIRKVSTKSSIETIYVDKKGKNLLDIGLGMYVGAIYSLYNPKAIYIYSKDKGYNSLIQIAEDFGYHNLYNISPEGEVLISDKEVNSLYKRVKNNCIENQLSLGEFKKKIRKSKLNINADEVNYIVNKLEEKEKIEIKDTGKHKIVILK